MTSVPEVVTPTEADAAELAEVLSFLQAHEGRYGDAGERQYFLAGTDEHDRVELTVQLHGILTQVVEALAKGQSISILTRDREITTQQAAELLGLSRPTVVRLINDGELDATVPGSVRRKLRLSDVLDYRKQLYERRSRFIAESADAYGDAGIDDVADLLNAARTKR